MNKKSLLFAVVLLIFGFTNAQTLTDNTQIVIADSNGIDQAVEKETIEEVITTKVPPAREKVKYLNQITRYGFKNLFANYTYNPTEPYSAQINANATSFIDAYVRTHSSYLNEMKSWGKPYFNLIESILQQYGLPRELKYIAVIESNLKSGAVSVKGAGGPWQFMPATARAMGLTINAYTDERTDYYKSTHAACKYLLQLYSQLNDWLLVMAAYNGGPGRVFSAIQRSGSRSFWDLQYYLPEESRTYVKRFIATHYIMEGNTGDNGEWAVSNVSMSMPAPEAYNNMGVKSGGTRYVNPYNIKINLEEDEINGIEIQNVSGKFNSLIIAKNLSLDIQDFNKMNPNFDFIISNNGSYDLRLPADKMQQFLANKYQILNECVQVLLNNDAVLGTPASNNKTFYKQHHKKFFGKKRR